MRLAIKVDEAHLGWPLREVWAGALSSLTLYVEDVPPGFTALEVQFGAPGRAEPFRAAGVRTLGGAWRVYAMPWCFPEASDGALEYQVIGTDAEGGRAWLGTGALHVRANNAGGSSEAPAIVPADTYVRNPVTGLYHKLTAEVNEHGEVTVAVEEEGVER